MGQNTMIQGIEDNEQNNILNDMPARWIFNSY